MGFSNKGWGNKFLRKIQPDPKEVGKYLNELRLDRKYTLRKVEEETGISNAYLSQIERGDRGIPNYSILKRLSIAYGVDFVELTMNIEFLTPSLSKPIKITSPHSAFIIKDYESLSEENKKVLTKFLHYLVNEEKSKSK